MKFALYCMSYVDKVNTTKSHSRVACIACIIISLSSTSVFPQDLPTNCLSVCENSNDTNYPNGVSDSSSMSLYLDNDGFAKSKKDEDYTGGIGLAFTGKTATNNPFSIDKGLYLIYTSLGVTSLLGQYDFTLHNFEVGMMAFTPTDIKAKEALEDNRPYASLIYISNTRHNVNLSTRSAWVATLSLGILGLPIVGQLQNTYHRGIGANKAEGWDHQISEGGEPTFRYTLTKQKHYDTKRRWLQVSSAFGVSAGYITEAVYGGSFRAGVIRTPWWSFNVNNGSYGTKSNTTYPRTKSINEYYFTAGANIKLRAYNVFLQGQFKDSVVEYASSEIEPLVYEGWVGFGCEFLSGIRISYIIRHQSSEVKRGLENHNFTYGELITSFKF